jgi:hypothetical protein
MLCDKSVTACRYANHISEEVAKLGYRGTICNGLAKWEHAKMGHAPPIWFVFSGMDRLTPLSFPAPLAARSDFHSCCSLVPA